MNYCIELIATNRDIRDESTTKVLYCNYTTKYDFPCFLKIEVISSNCLQKRIRLFKFH